LFTLERQYPAVNVSALPKADAIVVLGGGVSGQIPGVRPHIHLGRGATRVWFAAELYHSNLAPVVLISGGDGARTDGAQGSADASRQLLVDWGVPSSAIYIEPDSRNRIGNAARRAKLLADLDATSILLVTSAAN